MCHSCNWIHVLRLLMMGRWVENLYILVCFIIAPFLKKTSETLQIRIMCNLDSHIRDPPFGVVVICYFGLSSYLIFFGIRSSAISVAQDDRLRRSIRKSVEQQRTNLLDEIGTSEVQDRIFKRVYQTSKDLSDTMEEETQISPSLSSEQIAQYITEVMKERGMVEHK
jgi:hypothetical protein